MEHKAKMEIKREGYTTDAGIIRQIGSGQGTKWRPQA